ncbi:MAG: hypothetical protein LQ352_004234 [Teloschistes flavicans]|nr:MAG: hypothetical protein LQ352_004234 [Teloschistes flavicans]
MQPNSASRAFASPTSSKRGVLERLDVSADGPAVEDSLTGTQEDYFLSLFWQSYHCILQIIDEAEFREHYKSLWVTPETPRRASALVDIVLALCMQYGVASIPRSSAIQKPQVDVDGNDATIAGRWLYRRSQSLLSADLESPSIMTLQCQILAVYYLCNASFQNMAHTTLAVAVRTAQILGIHLEPPKNLPRKERELRKRLWWTLYAVESKTCMKLGRPWSAQLSQTTCSLPAHDHDLALLSGSTFAAFGGKVTWLTYNLQNTTLLLAASAIYIEFYDRCADVLGAIDGATLYSDSDTLESCAQSLVSSMEGLQAWLQDLPDELKTKRKGTGEPFSTDRTPLEMEMFVPLWLQRQRLLLELLYHNLAMNLYRPFISFSTTSSSNSQFTLGNAASCVNHAISITHIMHQVVVDSDLLCGWHEAFQWQWNAALSLIGYILAYPFTSSTSSARKAIDSAIDVFERFGRNFAIAANAANVTRDLTAKADILTHHFGSNMATPASSSSSSTDLRALQTYNGPQLISNEAYSAGLSSQPDTEPTATFSNNSPGMDLAFTIDSFNSFEPMLAGSTNMSNMWNFSQD